MSTFVQSFIHHFLYNYRLSKYVIEFIHWWKHFPPVLLWYILRTLYLCPSLLLSTVLGDPCGPGDVQTHHLWLHHYCRSHHLCGVSQKVSLKKKIFKTSASLVLLMYSVSVWQSIHFAKFFLKPCSSATWTSNLAWSRSVFVPFFW